MDITYNPFHPFTASLEEGAEMISISRSLTILALAITWSFAWSAYGVDGTTISGTVKNSTGGPYRGAFVKVRNVKTTMTFNVLSDSAGRYRVQNVPPYSLLMSGWPLCRKPGT